jgi:hypothetical protein
MKNGQPISIILMFVIYQRAAQPHEASYYGSEVRTQEIQ